MARRPSVLFAALAVAGCTATSQPPATASCGELAQHAIDLRVERRLDRVPEADRDAHRAAMAGTLQPAYVAACERMSASERGCWRDASTADDLSRCVLPNAEDATAVARLPGALTEEP